METSSTQQRRANSNENSVAAMGHTSPTKPADRKSDHNADMIIEETENGEKNALSFLHKLIRQNDWMGVRKILLYSSSGNQRSRAFTEMNSFSTPFQHPVSSPLMLIPNSIRWTGLHFAASNGTPNLDWWKWMLLRVLEEMSISSSVSSASDEIDDDSSEDEGKINKGSADRKVGLNFSMVPKNMSSLNKSEGVASYNYYSSTEQQLSCFHRTKNLEDANRISSCSLFNQMNQHKNRMRKSYQAKKKHSLYSSVSPFFARTEAGYAPVDLFFFRNIHPLPWQRPEVHEAALKLRENLNFFIEICQVVNNTAERGLQDTSSINDQGAECRTKANESSVQKNCASMPSTSGDIHRTHKKGLLIIRELRKRFRLKMQEEYLRQLRFGLDSNSLFLQMMGKNESEDWNLYCLKEMKNNPNDFDRKDNDDDATWQCGLVPADISLEHETFHTQNNESNDKFPTLAFHSSLEEKIQILVEFWHEMELLLMASYHGTLFLNEIDPTFGNVACSITNNDKKGEKRYGSAFSSWKLSTCVANESDTKHIKINDSAKRCTGQRRRKWRIVHALAHTDCPLEIAKLAILLYPEQVKDRDHNGNLPIHISASSPNTSTLAEGCWYSGSSNKSNKQGKNKYVRNVHTSSIMQVLLNQYPEGAMALDSNGRLPINLALCSGKFWETGIRNIFVACPHVLLSGTRDIPTRLYPFMIAAAEPSSMLYFSPRSCHSLIALDEDRGIVREREVTTGTIILKNEEEARAKRNASHTIGSMWKFLPIEAKENALEKARKHIEQIKLTTIYELLRIMPDAVRCRIDCEE